MGNNVYKIRLKITSKGKGKSGGGRVISIVESAVVGFTEIFDEETVVTLITIFDKSEVGNIPDKELRDLIEN